MGGPGFSPGKSAEDSWLDSLFMDGAVETMPRVFSQGTWTFSANTGKLTLFKAFRSINVQRLLFNLGPASGVAGATPHARLGLMAFDPVSGLITPLIESADDATILTGPTFSEVSRLADTARGLPANVNIVAGNWYYSAIFNSGYTSQPSLAAHGQVLSSTTLSATNRTPRLVIQNTGWTDLPAAPFNISTMGLASNPVWGAFLSS